MGDSSGEDFGVPGVVEWAHLDKKKFYFFAPLASFLTRFMLYPSNLVKTRLQAQNTVVYSGTFDAFRKIIKYEGVSALYKVNKVL
jgi:solute carrier family 25 protein 44